MNRYKITDAQITKAKKFLKGKVKNGPPWTVKYKDDLKVVGSKLLFKSKEVVSSEKVDVVLRREIYRKNSDVVPSRDSAFHTLKQRYSNISKRKIMEFLRAQKPLGETRAAVPKAKRSAGIKMKATTFETDLVFVKRDDLIAANPRFSRVDLEDAPELSYIVSTCEKVSGLYRCDWVKTKEAAEVTPIVIRHMEEMAKALKQPLSSCGYRSDRGGEFNMKEIKKVVDKKNAKHVAMGASVERRNQQVQQQFFRIIRSRKSYSIPDALKQSQILMNNTFSSIHKKTPKEMVSEGKQAENIKKFNKTRKSYISGDKRKEFEIGQHVRILVKDKKTGIEFKSYKNKSYSVQVYTIKGKTKKAIPPKYRLTNGRWYAKESLLKSAPRDKITDQLLKIREAEKAVEDRTERMKLNEKQRKQALEDLANPDKRQAAAKGRLKKLKADKKREEQLDREEDEEAGREIVVKPKKVAPPDKKAAGRAKLVARLRTYMVRNQLKDTGTFEELKKRKKEHKKWLYRMHLKNKKKKIRTAS